MSVQFCVHNNSVFTNVHRYCTGLEEHASLEADGRGRHNYSVYLNLQLETKFPFGTRQKELKLPQTVKGGQPKGTSHND